MQYRFRAGRSTLNAVQEVQKSLDKAFSMKPKPGGFCAVVTLDVKNSINTANWEHIYQALNRRLPVYLMTVTSSYLEGRTLMVETDDGTKEIEITAEVAQGSVGGPTISSAGCKNALSRRPVEERPISAPGPRTTYFGARSKNDLSRRPVEERPISASDSRTTYLLRDFCFSDFVVSALRTLKYGFYRHQTCV